MNGRSDIQGALGVTAAYVLWGALTLFWSLLFGVNSVYLLSQRIVWSMLFMAAFVCLTGRRRETLGVLRDGRKLTACFVCGVLIALNWGAYIFAVGSGHVLDASMGYFIEPMLVAAIGMLAFRERPSLLERLTFLFALAGLAYMIVRTRSFPFIALLIAGSFSAYGALKKRLGISPYVSLFVETLCLTPFALAFAVWAEANGMGSGALQGARLLLLPACGAVTLLPLLLFNLGVRRIPYYVSGILMYINPTLQFLLGVAYLHEPLDGDRLVAFVCIWIGIGFAVAEHLRQWRARRSARA